MHRQGAALAAMQGPWPYTAPGCTMLRAAHRPWLRNAPSCAPPPSRQGRRRTGEKGMVKVVRVGCSTEQSFGYVRRCNPLFLADHLLLTYHQEHGLL